MKKNKMSICLLVLFPLVYLNNAQNNANLIEEINCVEKKDNRPTKLHKPTIQRVNNFYQANSSKFYDVSGIGYGIDSIKGNYGNTNDIKTNADIFAPSFLDSKIKDGVLNSAMNKGQTRFESSNTIDQFEKKFKINTNYSSSISLDIPLFSASSSKNFCIDTKIDYKKYASSYFFHVLNDYRSYSFTLPNTVDLNEYRNNLSSSYVQSLENLFIDVNSYANFFENYGTHIVSKAVYGGLCEIFYSIVSNSLNLNLNLNVGASIDAKISGQLSSFAKLSGGASFEFNLNNLYGCCSENTKEMISATFSGGSHPIACNSINDIVNSFSSWSKTISDNPSLISMDTLIPLWDVLPVKFNDNYHKEIIKNCFREYANENKTNTTIFAYERQNTITDALNNDIRNNDIICSSNREDLPFDLFDLKKIEHSPKAMKAAGFSSMDIVLHTSYKATNKSLQMFLFLNDLGKYDNPSPTKTFSEVYVGPDNATHNTTLKFTVPIGVFLQTEKIVIKYASKYGKKVTIGNSELIVTYTLC